MRAAGEKIAKAAASPLPLSLLPIRFLLLLRSLLYQSFSSFNSFYVSDFQFIKSVTICDAYIVKLRYCVANRQIVICNTVPVKGRFCPSGCLFRSSERAYFHLHTLGSFSLFRDFCVHCVHNGNGMAWHTGSYDFLSCPFTAYILSQCHSQSPSGKQTNCIKSLYLTERNGTNRAEKMQVHFQDSKTRTEIGIFNFTPFLFFHSFAKGNRSKPTL